MNGVASPNDIKDTLASSSISSSIGFGRVKIPGYSEVILTSVKGVRNLGAYKF